MICMSKTRKVGWTEYVDIWEAFDICFGELGKEGILPKGK